MSGWFLLAVEVVLIVCCGCVAGLFLLFGEVPLVGCELGTWFGWFVVIY